MGGRFKHQAAQVCHPAAGQLQQISIRELGAAGFLSDSLAFEVV